MHRQPVSVDVFQHQRLLAHLQVGGRGREDGARPVRRGQVSRSPGAPGRNGETGQGLRARGSPGDWLPGACSYPVLLGLVILTRLTRF